MAFSMNDRETRGTAREDQGTSRGFLFLNERNAKGWGERNTPRTKKTRVSRSRGTQNYNSSAPGIAALATLLRIAFGYAVDGGAR